MCAALALAGLAVAVPAATAAPGAPDPSFGTGGMVVTTAFPFVGEDNSTFDGMRLLDDGTIQVQGLSRCSSSCAEGVLTRFTPAGRRTSGARYPWYDTDNDLDGPLPAGVGALTLPDGGLLASYGIGARHVIRVLARDGTVSREADLPYSFAPAAIAPDGRIVGFPGPRPASDGIFDGGRPVTLVRLNADLTPDPSFGVGGSVQLPPEFLRVGQVAVDATGTVRVAGWDGNAILLARVSASGALLGITRVPVSGLTANGASTSQLILRRARTLVVGRATTRRDSRTVIVGFRPDGRVDHGFGRRGILRTTGGQVAVRRDGRLVTGWIVRRGTAAASRARLAFRGFTATGRPDPAFPVRVARTPAPTLEGLAIALDRRERIVVAAPSVTLLDDTSRGGTGLLARVLTR